MCLSPQFDQRNVLYATKSISLNSCSKEVSIGILFVAYNSYFIGQIDNLKICASLIHQEGGSTWLYVVLYHLCLA
jgi:hypothetical protein